MRWEPANTVDREKRDTNIPTHEKLDGLRRLAETINFPEKLEQERNWRAEYNIRSATRLNEQNGMTTSFRLKTSLDA